VLYFLLYDSKLNGMHVNLGLCQNVVNCLCFGKMPKTAWWNDQPGNTCSRTQFWLFYMNRLVAMCFPLGNTNWLSQLLCFLELCDVGGAWLESYIKL